MSSPCVFLDRDGTLIEHYDYLTDPGQVELFPTAAPALRMLKERGFLLVMVTNQSAVARGMLTEQTLLAIHDRLKSLLAEQGAYLDQIYYCPYHPDGAVEQYRRDSELRKPSPGMLRLAARELDIDLAGSWLIGDDQRDIEAGRAAGCRTILVDSRSVSPLVQRGETAPDYRAVNLKEAANLIARYAAGRSSEGQADRDQVEARQAEEIEANTKQADTSMADGGAMGGVGSAADRDGSGVGVGSAPPIDGDGSGDGLGSIVNNNGSTVGAGSVTGDDVGAVDSRSTSDTDVEGVAGPSSTGTPERRLGKARPKKKPSSGRDGATKQLLGEILRELKTLNRHQSFTEFSVAKLLAGVVQMLVFLCLILAFWFYTGQEADVQAAQNCLLVGVILQTMTLTLLMMHRQ